MKVIQISFWKSLRSQLKRLKAIIIVFGVLSSQLYDIAFLTN